MSNHIRFLVLLWFSLLSACALELESAASPALPPQAPFVADPRQATRWEIKVQYVGDEKKKSGEGADEAGSTIRRPLSIQYHCGTDITHVIFIFSDRTRFDSYIKGRTILTKYDNISRVVVTTVREMDFAYPFLAKGFPGTAWITASDYAGLESLDKDKEKLHKFHRDAVIPKEGEPPESAVPELTAWIRPGDKTPVRFKIGSVTYLYSSIESASPSVTLPSEMVEVAQRVDKEQRALESMRKANQGQ